MKQLYIEVWEGSKETNKERCSPPGLATVGAKATPWSERTGQGIFRGAKRESKSYQGAP